MDIKKIKKIDRLNYLILNYKLNKYSGLNSSLRMLSLILLPENIFAYNKNININGLLQLFNVETLILTCDNNTDKNELIENLEYLHNKNNIKTIIIEVLTENQYKEILICKKDCIEQFIGDSYQAYEKEVSNKYDSIEEYLSLCNEDIDTLIMYLEQAKDEYFEDLNLEYKAKIRGDPYYRENIKYEDKKNKFLW